MNTERETLLPDRTEFRRSTSQKLLIALFSGVANKWLTLAFLGLALIFPATAFSSKLTAEQLFDKVLETYQNLKSLKFVVMRVDTATTPARQIETEVAVSKPGKVRLGDKLYELVSNGKTIWTYIKQRKEYKEIAAAPLLEETWTGSDLGLGGDITDGQYLYSWLDLAGEKGAAKLRSDKHIKVRGKKIDCYVVDISISRRSGPLDYLYSQQLWVDKSKLFVWRVESTTPESARVYATQSGITTLVFKEIEAGPIPDELFEFIPPNGVNRVDSFPGAGFFHRWSDVEAYDPPGA